MDENTIIDTVESYFAIMREDLELSEIETDYANSDISQFIGGIKFKYLDLYFELHKVENDDEFLENCKSYSNIFCYENEISFTPKIEETLIDFSSMYTLYVKEPFVLVIKSLVGMSNSLFIKNYYKLMYHFFEV